MKIAVLGWGSLIWDPLGLPVRKPWFMDGPLLPIEFARQSEGDRITLVLASNLACVRSLWALMSVTDLEKAKEELADREKISEDNTSKYIGCWPPSSTSKHEFVDVIGKWATQKGLDAVVWTALPSNLSKESGNIPTVDDVISILRKLPYEKRKHAEEYIRKAPLQIDTDYRRKIEEKFNWTPLADY